ncbi:MAG: hypothetical protein GX567_03280 [Clostridia bacterium]|nr:hypothetical protein [Clostridia bacterium]
MIKEIFKKTLILSAIMIFAVFLISYLFFGAPKDILIVFEIFLLAFLIISMQQISRNCFLENYLLNLLIEYIAVSVFVLLYGYFWNWFMKSNWWVAFIYVAIVYIPAYFLDMVIVKKEVDYINAQLERKREHERTL